MAVADVLETRISTRARKEQVSQNYLEHDCCRQNENDIPIKDDTVAENWAKNLKNISLRDEIFFSKYTCLEMASRKIQTRICILFILCMTWTVNIVIKQICSWLPPFCKLNLLIFIQPRWQQRTYLFNHYNVYWTVYDLDGEYSD